MKGFKAPIDSNTTTTKQDKHPKRRRSPRFQSSSDTKELETSQASLLHPWYSSNRLKTYHYDEIPEYLQDNDYIRRYYRADYTFTGLIPSL